MDQALRRDASIDTIKALASQLIVLHHIAFYGPMSESARTLAPGLIGWLGDPARIAVQAFLVIGGFLCAKAIAPGGVLSAERPMQLLAGRYLRLAPPFVAAMLVAIAGAAIARTLIEHDSIPAAPTAFQLLAHGLLLHDLLGVDALSAGVWYVAIDFQLFALMLALLWAVRGIGAGAGAGWGRRAWLGPLAVLAAALASLFVFNLDPAFDVWAPYFFGAYALGAFAFWATTRAIPPAWFAFAAACAVLALAVDFRARLVVALAIALLLALGARSRFGFGLLVGSALGARADRLVAFLGRISYATFLVHFPVFLVVNAVFSRFSGGDPILNAAGMFVAWAASIAAGAAFHRQVEYRFGAPRRLSPR